MFFQIMLTHIGSIDKLPLSTSGSPLLIRCKNFLSVNFVIPRERECHDVYTTLLKLCQPGKFIEKLNILFRWLIFWGKLFDQQFT